MQEEFEKYISKTDLLLALRAQCGSDFTLKDYRIERATSSVQGFTSFMLRVISTLEINGEILETRMIAKTLPILKAQLNFVEEYKIFHRESAYFNEIVPLLKSNYAEELPIVKCYLALNNTLYLEDLCEDGYETLVTTKQEVARVDLLQVEHIVIAFQKLAHLHVASLDIDWYSVVPQYLEKDVLFQEGTFKKKLASACKTIITAMHELYPSRNWSVYEEWLMHDNCFNCMKQLSKPVTGSVNVLNHGDFWLLNMMFKMKPDELSKILDVKYFDFQIFRFTSPTRDLLYFLYTCTSRAFRLANEKHFIRSYVDAFNSAACRKPNLFSYESFLAEYESARVFGMGMAIAVRPMLVMQNVLPEAGEELSDDAFTSIVTGDHSEITRKQLRDDPAFRELVINIIDEIIDVLDRIHDN